MWFSVKCSLDIDYYFIIMNIIVVYIKGYPLEISHSISD